MRGPFPKPSRSLYISLLTLVLASFSSFFSLCVGVEEDGKVGVEGDGGGGDESDGKEWVFVKMEWREWNTGV